MARPVIGVVAHSIANESRPPAVSVGRKYLDALVSAGGVPWLIPLIPNDPGVLAEIAGRIDGLYLTGGADIHPSRYGEARHPTAGDHDPDRDATEIRMLALAAERDLPVFGICRGLQIINVAAGGSLYQDIRGQIPAAFDHNSDLARDSLIHEIAVTPGSRLAGILGETQAEVNSLHHQAVKDLGTGLRPAAYSPDGVIEAVEGTDSRFVVGVQWHPEELTDAHPAMRRLFTAFLEAATK